MGKVKKYPPHLRFKGFLAENEKTQSDVAIILEITKTTVNQKMNGYSDFDACEIEKICNELGCDTDIFCRTPQQIKLQRR